MTRVSKRIRRMKHLSTQDRLHLKEKSINLYRYLVELHTYCKTSQNFVISDPLEDAITDVCTHYFSKISTKFFLLSIDYIFKKIPEQFHKLKHEMYYQS